ncbi:hypothetical protein P7K49_027514 [Saguinus oedipus]|uniref:Putative adherens-junction anchoring domain-containing protein n=1 Tax=Saguinus oedipus TaxID=9490 RepID=A0ABQ9U9P5_SAGOE|nr:hypothetical protein P7K49_027514 [Saguinus oedipus]
MREGERGRKEEGKEGGKERREGRREGRKEGGREGREGRKEEGRKERKGRRKGRREGRKGGKEGKKEGRREGRKEGGKEEGREGRREGGKEGGKERGKEGGKERKKGGKEGGKEGRREGRREGEREGRREGRREGGKEGKREGRREGGKEGGKEGRKEGGKEGGKERGKEGRTLSVTQIHIPSTIPGGVPNFLPTHQTKRCRAQGVPKSALPVPPPPVPGQLCPSFCRTQDLCLAPGTFLLRLCTVRRSLELCHNIALGLGGCSQPGWEDREGGVGRQPVTWNHLSGCSPQNHWNPPDQPAPFPPPWNPKPLMLSPPLSGVYAHLRPKWTPGGQDPIRDGGPIAFSLSPGQKSVKCPKPLRDSARPSLPALSTSSSSSAPVPPTETTRPDSNIYKKPPIYKQRESVGGSPQTKHLIEDLIIESSKFPAAQPPDPNQPAKIETDYWPCPPSLAVVETEWRKRKASRRGAEEEEEEEDDDSGEEMKALRERQKEELSKVSACEGTPRLYAAFQRTLLDIRVKGTEKGAPTTAGS